MIHALESGVIVQTMTDELIGRTSVLPDAPHLVVLEGYDGHSALADGQAEEVNAYVNAKLKIAQGVGVVANHVWVPTHELPDHIDESNEDFWVDAMILEVPVPGFEREETIALAASMDPAKAADNQGAEPVWGMDATSEATVSLLDYHGRTGAGETVLVVGAKGRVGSQVAAEYERRGNVGDLLKADVHNKEDLSKYAAAAGIIVLATGDRHHFIPDFVRPGQAIVSVGAHDVHPHVRDPNNFDFDFSLTPLKGGVGPLTTRRLLRRVVHLAEGGRPFHPFSDAALASARR